MSRAAGHSNVITRAASPARRFPAALIATCVLAVLIASMLATAGCAATGSVGEDSPGVSSVQVASGSDLTESGQYVEVRVAFDAPVQASGDVTRDLDISLNGGKVDDKTIEVQATTEDGQLVVRLTPTREADGSSASVYFALYEGQLRIAARSSDGALPHVCMVDDGETCAVMPEAVCISVPSGVTWETVQARPGDAGTGTPAQTTVRVTQFAQLRCITWLGLSFTGDVPRNSYGTPDFTSEATTDGTLALKHNHLFLRDTQGICAANMADVINQAWGEQVVAEATGDTITITSRTCEDGQTLALFAFEGRYDER